MCRHQCNSPLFWPLYGSGVAWIHVPVVTPHPMWISATQCVKPSPFTFACWWCPNVFSALFILQVKRMSFPRSLSGSFLLSWQQQQQRITWPTVRAMPSQPSLPGNRVLYQTVSGTVGPRAGHAGTRWRNISATTRLKGRTFAPEDQGRSPTSSESSQPQLRLRGGRHQPRPPSLHHNTSWWIEGSLRATQPPTTTPTQPPALTRRSLPAGSNPPRLSWKQPKPRQPGKSGWAEEHRQPLPVQKTVLWTTGGLAPRASSPVLTEAPTPPSTTTFQGCQSRKSRSWSLRDLRPEWGPLAVIHPSVYHPSIRAAPAVDQVWLGASCPSHQGKGWPNIHFLIRFPTTVQQESRLATLAARASTTRLLSSSPPAELQQRSPSSIPPTVWAWTTEERTDSTVRPPDSPHHPVWRTGNERTPPPSGSPTAFPQRRLSWTTPTPPIAGSRHLAPPTTPVTPGPPRSTPCSWNPKGAPPQSTCNSSPPPHRSMLRWTTGSRAIGEPRRTRTTFQKAGLGGP